LADDGDPGRWVAVCTGARLTEQRIVCGNVAGVGILVVQDGAQIYACERACPHEQADLSLGRVADGRLYCPRHLAWFNLTDGNISPGWPSRGLRRYPVRVRDEQIWVDKASIAAL
jgi:3-phenylpropionate/trans-cinnamate dioxygenase ferredoxin subunit